MWASTNLIYELGGGGVNLLSWLWSTLTIRQGRQIKHNLSSNK